MSVRKPHSNSPHDPHSADALADHYLARHDGLSFDFDMYRVAIGGAGNDRLNQSSRNDYLWGRGGDDTIGGGGGKDVLYGGAGKDIVSGNAGADLLYGGTGNDRLYGATMSDTLRGEEGNDYLDEGAGHGDLEGGPGNDTLAGGQGPDAFTLDRMSGDDLIKDFTAGPGMFDHLALVGLRWEDLTITETAAGTRVSWAGGSVLLEGVRKGDLAQDDFMFADAPDLPPAARDAPGPAPERPSPSVPGPQVTSSTQSGEQKSFDAKADAMLKDGGLAFDFERYEVEAGTKRADHMDGDASWDNMFGRAGNDTLNGRGGNDVLNGDAGNDVLRGDDGMDQLDGGSGNDRLYGGAMGDMLMGEDGADRLEAGAGHDMLEGGRGNDTLVGGTGADAFIVDPMSGNDVVFDFEATGPAQGAFDHLALRDIDAGDLSIRDTRQGALISWDVNDDGRSDGSILLKDVDVAELRQSDFMFVNEPQFVPGISDSGSDYLFPA